MGVALLYDDPAITLRACRKPPTPINARARRRKPRKASGSCTRHPNYPERETATVISETQSRDIDRELA